MKIGETLYITDRKFWRQWLKRNHSAKKEIWLVYMKKGSGKPRISYNDAVEEALCYGWIDSILKPIDMYKYAQRFSPRRNGSKLSDMNKERIRRLLGRGKMTRAGLAALKHIPDVFSKNSDFAPDIMNALKSDRTAWNNFRKFPASYKRIRVGWIEMARKRPDIFNKRLRYFLKMTASNRQFGMVK